MPKRVLALAAVAVAAWIGWSLVFGGSSGDSGRASASPDAAEQADASSASPDADSVESAAPEPEGDGFDSVAAGLGSRAGGPPTPPDVFRPTPAPDLADLRAGANDPSPAYAGSSETAEGADASADDTPALAVAEREEPADARPTGRPSDSSEPRSDREARDLMEQGQAVFEQGELVDARAVLNTALSSGGLNETDAREVRNLMEHINDTLVFSRRIHPDDPYVDSYEIQSGDALSRIAPRYNVPWEVIADINGISNPDSIRVGQSIKVVKGPFHVVVHKRAYRLDLFLGDMFVRSYPVGLGEDDMTPTGEFIVRGDSRLSNPEWTNPRTGERYLPDDPENPLGGYWIGIRGTTPETERYTGYGIHGTIEPDTIGTDASMGCVRLLPEDIAQLYRMLTEEQTRVLVVN